MVEKTDKKLGEILLEEEVISAEQLEKALDKQKTSDKKLGDILLDQGLIGEAKLTDFLSRQTGCPLVNLDSFPVQKQAVKTISRDQAERYQVLPVSLENNILTVAMADPFDIIALDDLEQLTGYEIEPVISRSTQIVQFIDRFYSGESAPEKARQVKFKTEMSGLQSEVSFGPGKKQPGPAVRMVDRIIEDALERNASTIQINPYEKYTQIIFKIDGVSRHYTDLPSRIHDAVASRIELIAEKSSGQDSNYKFFQVSYGEEKVIFRLRYTETRFGDKITVRVCRESNYERTVLDLGVETQDMSALEGFLSAPRGLVLFTGPADSGKTTSLYSSLQYFSDTPNTIITVENPVEYNLDYCTQLEVPGDSPKKQANLIYEAVKTDPDILAVGEMGEPRVARAVLYAAATGRKLLSTYYADNAIDAVFSLAKTRGIDRFQLANSLVGVVAQRLVRIIDPEYREKYKPSWSEIDRLGLSEGATCYQPSEAAGNEPGAGYRDRTAVFQFLPVNDDLRLCILNDDPYCAYQEVVRNLKIPSLREKGAEKILSGVTSVEELLRATFREDFVESFNLACR